MLNFTCEDDIKIKYKQAAGISRAYYLSKETNSRPPQSFETIPLSKIKFCSCFKIYSFYEHINKFISARLLYIAQWNGKI
jgi:hypothetical protein